MAQLNMVKAGHVGGYIQGGDPGSWCPHLWQWAVRRFGIRSVLDVGCGEGHSTRFFQELGCDVLGVDGCEQAVAESVVPGCTVLHDFADGPFIPGRSYDLIWSCEFLEHVNEEYVPSILTTFAAARVIFLTHAFPKQRGHHHVNCRPSSYWISLLEKAGFECSVDLSLEARTVTLADAGNINHFARSGLVFLKRNHSLPTGMFTRIVSHFRARAKALRINTGFRWSAICRRHRRRWKALKRQRKHTMSV
jgi:SAM-dependent methyltransferase